MASQTWRGALWTHDLVVCTPSDGRTNRTWVLHVTGGEPNDFDVQWSQGLADLSGCPVAILFQIPNQPLWEMTEDDLIAHTFDKFIDTGDVEWPLLFPMVKSVVRAMDALQEFGERLFPGGGPEQFVVFGASKRGWTSWLTAATGDSRVCGIAPMLFDHLNMPAQLEKQIRDWGHFSPMIQDYTSRGLEQEVGSENGRKLVAMVDPYTYLDSIKVPVLAIHGANDPYWTLDASSLYWDKIRGPKWMVTVPNLHHAFEMTQWWTPSLAAFVHAIGSSQIPSLSHPHAVRGFELWKAFSETRNFSDAEWTAGEEGDLSRIRRYVAAFRRVRGVLDGIDFYSNQPPRVEEILATRA